MFSHENPATTTTIFELTLEKHTGMCIYIYMVPPPQDPYFLRIYWYLRYFVVFYYV